MITLIFLILIFRGTLRIIKALVKLALTLLCIIIDVILILAIIGICSVLI